MSKESIQELLVKLKNEVQQTELDLETRQLIEEFDSDIQSLLSPAPEAVDFISVAERATVLETKFATRHPNVERFLREIVETLAKLGI